MNKIKIIYIELLKFNGQIKNITHFKYNRYIMHVDVIINKKFVPSHVWLLPI